MATTVVKTVVQFRRDTTKNWLLYKDVVPAAGEPCFDLDLHTLKIGDGVKSYSELNAIGGIDISVDGKSLIITDGTFKLAGFDAAEIGAQPRKNADGDLEWVVPSAETLDGLQAIIAGLQSDVKTLKQDVVSNTESIMSLLDRIEGVETKVGPNSVDAQIDAALKNIIAGDTNAINSISMGGTVLDIVEKCVDIPIATSNKVGVVKGSTEINVAEDGTLSIVAVNVDKLVQSKDSTLVFNSGGATGTT